MHEHRLKKGNKNLMSLKIQSNHKAVALESEKKTSRPTETKLTSCKVLSTENGKKLET